MPACLAMARWEATGLTEQQLAILHGIRFEVADLTDLHLGEADGNRVRKQIGSDWTDYVYFGGNAVAEKKPNGDWSDYVYVGGRRIARTDTYEDGISIQGTNSTIGIANTFQFPNAGGLQGYTIRSGDKLLFRQAQIGVARGGIYVGFSDGSVANWVTYDQDGQQINSDNTAGGWHYRRVDMSQWTGKTISILSLLTDTNTGAGTWQVIYGDIALLSLDGTVRPVYNGQSTLPAFSLWSSNPAGTSNVTYSDRHLSNIGWNPNTTTNYYSSDHLGSARMILSYWGYPTSSATYLPFGQEWNSQISINHYKFTGYERDTESSLDFASARHYATNQGRFMSPDPLGGAQESPQSWNRYSYVHNNPVGATDPSGLCSEDDGWFCGTLFLGFSGQGLFDMGDTFSMWGGFFLSDGGYFFTGDTSPLTAQWSLNNVLFGGTWTNSGNLFYTPSMADRGMGEWADALPLAANVAQPGVNLSGQILLAWSTIATGAKMDEPISFVATDQELLQQTLNQAINEMLARAASGGQVIAAGYGDSDTLRARTQCPLLSQQELGLYPDDSWLQLDCVIEHGDSGGAIVLVDGGRPWLIGIIAGSGKNPKVPGKSMALAANARNFAPYVAPVALAAPAPSNTVASAQ